MLQISLLILNVLKSSEKYVSDSLLMNFYFIRGEKSKILQMYQQRTERLEVTYYIYLCKWPFLSLTF